MRRVMVTGMGMVCALGNSVDETWKALLRAKTGITGLDRPGFHDLPAAQLKDMEKLRRRSSFGCREDFGGKAFVMAAAAASEALEQAGIDSGDSLCLRGAALILGGSSANGRTEEMYGLLRSLSDGTPEERIFWPDFAPGMRDPDTAPLLAAILGIRGQVQTIYNACASSAMAIGRGFDLIRTKKAELVICGGSDAGTGLNELSLFSVLKAASTGEDPAEACRPFSKDRRGCVIGEGAGILILESEEHAASRRVQPLAEILGYGTATDTHHVTSPDMDGHSYAESMRGALLSSGLSPADVGYINAHGTGTYYNDMIETRAIRQVFDEIADTVPVSSTKAATGHLLSAAGSAEAVITVQAVRNGCLPPTLNLKVPDAECDLDYVPENARKKVIRAALTNSFGFGGQNVTIAIGGVEHE